MLDKNIVNVQLYYMKYNCPVCTIDPKSHSLTLMHEEDDILYFYTCPSEAKLYYDCEGIIKHYNGVLSEIDKSKKWVWIFDSKDFGIKHFSQIKVGVELAKLISQKFYNNLLNICIINSTIYTYSTYKIVKFFLYNDINNKILFFENKYLDKNDMLQFLQKHIKNKYIL